MLKNTFFLVLVLEDVVGFHVNVVERVKFSFFGISGWGIDLNYCDTEWFALETSRDHSVIFETASKYCISDSFVDYDGYSISSGKSEIVTHWDIKHGQSYYEKKN